MKLLTKAILIAALLVAIDPLVRAEDWSLFRGDPQLHGRSRKRACGKIMSIIRADTVEQ